MTARSHDECTLDTERTTSNINRHAKHGTTALERTTLPMTLDTSDTVAQNVTSAGGRLVS